MYKINSWNTCLSSELYIVKGEEKILFCWILPVIVEGLVEKGLLQL